VTTRHPGRPRTHRTDLLVRPPCSEDEREGGWAGFVVDPVEQLKALADLHSRGLLSREEFDRQKTKLPEP